MGKDRPYHSQIMIIDNDKYVRESLSTFFSKSPLRVLIFKSASEGLNALKYQDIDVVVSDYFLPDMDGLVFLNQVAIEKPGVPRVLMATLTNDEMAVGIAKAGIYKFIEKPLNIDALETIIKELEIIKLSKLFPSGESNE
ncbi:MAG: response regulator [Proteobacteria bacterium]|nr:response regulator [Pseudomonadota bacterium]MBU1581224.1 response regulator [Pseudomonadota bacterium]MBU2455915.1 response regulator [Pseudomonadota bacterium]MBU2627987.1 response regulator [Pseudomonadota bacterium]